MTRTMDETGGDFATVLERLCSESRRYFGEAGVKLRPIGASKQRYSRVLRVRVDRPSGTELIFLKRLGSPDPAGRRAGIQAEFDALRRAYAAMAEWPGLDVARPIACFPDEATLVTAAAPGRTLTQLLNSALLPLSRRSSSELVRTFERVGLWLRLYQESEPPAGTISIPALREDLRVRLDKLVRGPARFSASDRAALLAYFEAHCNEIRECDLAEVPVHGDFCPANVLARDGDITVIDLSTARRGARLHDLTHMFMHQ
jgi:hypothetical protein